MATAPIHQQSVGVGGVVQVVLCGGAAASTSAEHGSVDAQPPSSLSSSLSTASWEVERTRCALQGVLYPLHPSTAPLHGRRKATLLSPPSTPPPSPTAQLPTNSHLLSSLHPSPLLPPHLHSLTTSQHIPPLDPQPSISLSFLSPRDVSLCFLLAHPPSALATAASLLSSSRPLLPLPYLPFPLPFIPPPPCPEQPESDPSHPFLDICPFPTCLSPHLRPLPSSHPSPSLSLFLPPVSLCMWTRTP